MDSRKKHVILYLENKGCLKVSFWRVENIKIFLKDICCNAVCLLLLLLYEYIRYPLILYLRNEKSKDVPTCFTFEVICTLPFVEFIFTFVPNNPGSYSSV